MKRSLCSELTKKADAAFEKGRFADASKLHVQSIRSARKKSLKDEMAHAMVHYAIFLLNRGNLAEAFNKVNQIVDVYPDKCTSEQSLSNLIEASKLYWLLGHDPLSIDTALEAAVWSREANRQGVFVNALLWLTELTLFYGQYRAAEEYGHKAVIIARKERLALEQVIALRLLGCLHAGLSNHREALKNLRLSLRIAEVHRFGAQRVLIYYALAEVLASTGRDDSAHEALNKAAKLMKNSSIFISHYPLAMLARLRAELKLGQYQIALDLTQATLGSDSFLSMSRLRGELLALSGQALIGLNRYEVAKEKLLQSFRTEMETQYVPQQSLKTRLNGLVTVYIHMNRSEAAVKLSEITAQIGAVSEEGTQGGSPTEQLSLLVHAKLQPFLKELSEIGPKWIRRPGLSINLDTGDVFKDGRDENTPPDVVLTVRERFIVRSINRRNGGTVNSETIVAEYGGVSISVDTVRKHISKINKKLTPYVLIINSWGDGYRILPY